MASSIKNHLKLLQQIETVKDARIDRKKLYPLNEILFLTVNAVVCGYSTWEEIFDFGVAKLDWLKGYLPYQNGIPSHDTINRAISLIDYRSFEAFFTAWVDGLITDVEGKLINIDGKKVRSSVDKARQNQPKSEGGKAAIHLVEAWCSELNMCLGQYKTEDKSNEITAIPALLDMLDIGGSTVSLDAMGCQKTIAVKIIEKEGDYIFGLKGNQEKIHDAVVKLFENQTDKMEVDEKITIGHGRVEVRECRVLSASLLPENMQNDWKGLTCLIEICSTRLIVASNKYSVECRYYLGSKEQGAGDYNCDIRGHWGIENQLHWVMDVIFGEDKSRKRANNAAQNFGIIRRLALNLLKNNGDKPLVSIHRRMNKSVLDDEYRRKTLNF